jgi:hypothetical protein
MPGLLRAVGRTAVVAGTATAVSNRVSRRQANRWSDQAAAEQYAAEQSQPQAPPPPAPSQDDTLAKLKELGELKTAGVLTDAEFEAQKAKILAGM